mmetsp:Transcript_34830/g.58156  ORF Transcript_34830/g.58156 Transcript_34830/m.58156 type:complete len:217 (-) Transcript_34830:414-1064(-)
MPATLFLLQHINLALEFSVGTNGARLGDHHTTLQTLLLQATHEDANIVSSLCTVHDLAEGLNSNTSGFLRIFISINCQLVTRLYDPCANLTSADSTASTDVKNLLNGHQKRFIERPFRKFNTAVKSIHKLLQLGFPLLVTLQAQQSRPMNEGDLVGIELVLIQKLPQLHLNKLEHLLIILLVTFVDEHHKVGDPDLMGQQDVLPSLGHGTICSSDH